MSTDFLNRRMDLTHAVSDNSYYELIMDTSYPVKLAGKVIKLFNAADSYVAYYPWKLLNSEEEVILEVPYNKVYDFAGNAIHDCIGEGKTYESGSDVFTEQDYVMVIIDFDAQTLHLCSETNFKNFFLNAGKGNLKLFDVTAGDGETITVENMNIINTSDSINVDKSIFENASNFENKDKNTYALVRSDKTNVLYEVPVTGDNIHSVVPVSDINAIDINALAMNLMNFIFPFMNPASNPSGFESVGDLYSLFEINGQFTDEFIEKYCYTKDEIESFKERCNNAGGNSFNLFSKYNQTENKENYVYVLATDGFSLGSDDSECTDKHIFGAINKKTKRYAVTEINTVANLINGKAGDLPISKNPDTGNLIGSWWTGDKFSPSMVMYVQGGNKRSPRLYVNAEEQTNGNNYAYSYKYMYDSYDGSQQINPENTKYRKEGFVIIGANHPNNDTQAYELSEYKHAKRFIEFFGNADTEYVDVIKRNALAPMAPDGFRYPLWLNNYNGEELINAIAMNLVVEFAEPFEHVLFDSDSSGYIHADQNIHNFTTFGDGNVTDETRTNYKQDYISCLNAERIHALIYSLVDCDATGKSYYCTTGLNGTGNLARLDTAVINGVSHKIKFKSCMSIAKDSHVNLVTQSKDNNISNFMITPITRIICGSIDKAWDHYDDSKPDGNAYSETYNNAQIKYQTFYIYKKINFANEKISFANGSSIQLAYQDSPSTKQDLFIIAKATDSEKANPSSISGSDNAKKYIKVELSSNRIIFKPATLGGDSYPNLYKRDVTVLDDQCTPDNGVSYLYYFTEYTDTINNKKYNTLYRVKYYYKDTSNTFDNSFDYLSQPVEVCRLVNGLIENTNDIYTKAFVGSYAYEQGITDIATAVDNANVILTNTYPDSVEDYENKRLVHIALTVVQYFKFYPYDIYNDSHVFIQEYNQEIAIDWIGITTSTSGLTLGSDEFVCWNLSPFYTDWTLKNMLGNDVVLYQNSKAPHVSNTKYDGSLIYTVETYNKYLKDNSISTLFDVKELEYLRGTGVRDAYLYKPNTNTRTPISLYQFYLNWYTRDLARNPDVSLKENLNRQMCFIAKDVININDAKVEWTNASGTNKNIFKNNNTSEPIEIKYYGDNMSYVKCEINSSNILGFNQSVLNKYNKDSSTVEDITDKYIEKNPIFVNEIIAGNKKTYSISMNSVNSYEELTNPSIYSIYGNSADMQVDKIDWNSLLVALNNNYKLDILTDSLISFKNQLNTFIYSNCININDSVEYNVSKNTESDIIADSDPGDPFPPTSDWYRTTHGTYDSKHDIYTYYPGYGFDTTQKRNNDERGVIVFVSDDSYVTRNKHGSGDPDIWTYDSKYPNVYPKRMYVSADGIVCTKDFYDLGSIFNDNNHSVDLHDLISRITTLEEEVARLRNNT